MSKKIYLLILLLFMSFLIILQNNNTKEQQNINYQTEYEYLLEKVHSNEIDNIRDDHPFKIEAILKKDNTRNGIIYKVKLYEPEENMNEVVISVLLNQKVFEYLKTPTIFYTTLGNPNKINLDPVNINTYTVSNSFAIDENKVNNGVFRYYKDIYLKISWKDEKGILNEEYLKVEGEPTEELINLINKLM